MTKKILLVLTSNDKLGDTGNQTGWYLPEAAHPYIEFKKAGYQIDFASIKGGAAPCDNGSIDASKEDAGCMSFLNDAETKALYSNTKALKDVDASAYDAIFFAGGFGVMWDIAQDTESVPKAIMQVWNKGGVVSAVCHGPGCFANAKFEDGTPLVKGKEVAAFTNEEEDAVKLRSVVPFTCEDKLKELGANFTKAGVFEPHVAVAGKLITGQNPPSSKPCAEAVIKALA